jgi:Secretion system C-terminal sorting domain/Outer membrane protein SusF_SusE
MKLRLLFSFFLSCLFLTAFSQISVGIIGSATPTGWDSDTDMTQNPDSAHLWSIDIVLVPGECKFRQDNAWDINWGSADFPSGIGTNGGDNIPITYGGTYNVTLNSITGAYNFEVFSDIGIIGDATPKGWGEDTNMFQDAVDTNVYKITIDLSLGKVKFRQNDAWAIAWGGVDFPTGVATLTAGNLSIPAAGKYEVTFNKSTGDYSFLEVIAFSSISVIGDATPGGTDVELTKDAGNPNLWKGDVVLLDGKLKFRANAAWTISWGATVFPGTGVATNPGPDLIVTAGEYRITFNTETFEYSFALIVDYATLGIIGSATPNGSDTDTYMERDAIDKTIWRLRAICTDGELKFRANSNFAESWGGGDFPMDTATLDETASGILMPAGEYKIVFNSLTGFFNFEELVIYSSVAITGTSAPSGSWSIDDQMVQVSDFVWQIPSAVMLESLDGAKFRAEGAWTINWGAAAWPAGVGTQGGPNIPVVAGTYRVTLNTATGDYSFVDPNSISTVNVLSNNLITLSPNPAFDVVSIAINEAGLRGDVTVKIYDNQGKLVVNQNMTIGVSANINVANLKSGNYMVQLSNSKFTIGKTLVVVK